MIAIIVCILALIACTLVIVANKYKEDIWYEIYVKMGWLDK